MDPHSNIWREIMRVEAEIDSPASRGKRTILKAYHRKLCSQYRKARADSERALGQADYDRGEVCPIHYPDRAAGWREAAAKALLKRPAETGYPRTYGDWHPGDEM